MAIVLKDGSTTQDRRLDRLVLFDEESRHYPVRQLVATKQPRSYTWRLPVYLDQGHEGACVGFSFSHELAARPNEVPSISNITARQVYFEAQKIDPWPGGAYAGAQPFYEGTAVLAGAKYLQSKGYFKEYRWAFNLNDVLLAVGYQGPGVLGANWYEGMMEPDSKGFIHPTGNVVGGHAIVVRGVNVKTKTIRLSNSWGRSWGVDGDCFMTFDEFEKVLLDDGEFCIPIGRSTPK